MPCPKATQFVIDPLAPRHVGHREPSFLGKTDIDHAAFFQCREIVRRGKRPIHTHLARHVPKQALLAAHERHGPGDIARIPLRDGAIENESAALVTSWSFRAASERGDTRRSVAASADFEGVAVSALTRQKVRYVMESAR